MNDPLENLTANQKKVYAALLQRGTPVKAYDLLDLLKHSGVRAPMTVYRALSELEDRGLIIRVEGTKAYLAIDTLADGTDLIVLFICQRCSSARSHSSPKLRDLVHRIRDIAGDIDFALEPGRAEIYGTCASCRSGSPS